MLIYLLKWKLFPDFGYFCIKFTISIHIYCCVSLILNYWHTYCFFQLNPLYMDTVASNNKIKILVVDDNLLNRKLACAVLKSYNLDYDIAENGKIAYDYYLTGNYDLILMDIQMPIMTGIECTRKIREYEKNSDSSSTIPIIAVTTFTMVSDKKNCYDAGINEVLAKPYKTSDMIEMISKYIDIEDTDN